MTIRIRGTARFSGTLLSISETNGEMQATIHSDTHGVVRTPISQTQGRGIRGLLSHPIRVSGRCLWDRSDEGLWQVTEFVLGDFIPARTETVAQCVHRIRTMAIDWPNDPIAAIAQLEDRDGAAPSSRDSTHRA